MEDNHMSQKKEGRGLFICLIVGFLLLLILGVALLIWGIRIGPGGGITNQVTS